MEGGEKQQPPGLRSHAAIRVPPCLPGSQGARVEARKETWGRSEGRDERRVSGQASRPGSQPPSTSSSHETPPEAYSKFPFLLAKSPFVKLAGSCFLLLENKNILTHLVSHNSILTAHQPGWPQWRKGPGRGGLSAFRTLLSSQHHPSGCSGCHNGHFSHSCPFRCIFLQVPLVSKYFGY